MEVVEKAYSEHRYNVSEMQYLIDYERGVQPLQRDKIIYPEIDIRTVDNIANYAKEFHLGYFWGQPMTYIRRKGDDDEEGNTSEAICKLDKMIKNNVGIGYKDQKLAEFIEICGIGHRFVDAKRSFNDGSLVDVYTLDSRNAFIVYFDDIAQTKALGVTFGKRNGEEVFTCFTNEHQYTIADGKVTRTTNILGLIPIVEFERAYDRTGFFERQVSMMDNLNIKVSDFANNVSQTVQEMWWGNDVEFPKDEKGNTVTPKTGQWFLTYSGENKQPKIQALSSSLDSNSLQNDIQNTRNEILKRLNVPIQYDSSGGGSTGVAMNAASGWSATETDAMRKQQMIEKGKREELELIIRAINLVPNKYLPVGDPLRELVNADIDFHFDRNKNYDMAVKANTFATYVAHGLHGKHALEACNAFGSVAQVWEDSKELIEQYQQSVFGPETTTENSDKIMSDNSDQISNSPLIDGMRTE